MTLLLLYTGTGLTVNLCQAIMDRFELTPHSDFWADVNGRLFFNEEPAGTTGDYAVFSFIGEAPDYYFNNMYMDETLVQFDLYSDSQSSANVLNMLTHLRTVYDDARVEISGFTPYKFEYDLDITDRILQDNTWWCSVQYRCIQGHD